MPYDRDSMGSSTPGRRRKSKPSLAKMRIFKSLGKVPSEAVCESCGEHFLASPQYLCHPEAAHQDLRSQFERHLCKASRSDN